MTIKLAEASNSIIDTIRTVRIADGVLEIGFPSIVWERNFHSTFQFILSEHEKKYICALSKEFSLSLSSALQAIVRNHQHFSSVEGEKRREWCSFDRLYFSPVHEDVDRYIQGERYKDWQARTKKEADIDVKRWYPQATWQRRAGPGLERGSASGE